MPGLGDLTREYERSRFPADRRLDLHGEGPKAARERALHWIQSHAHEEPGAELLLIVERVVRPGRPPAAVAVEVQKLLVELEGRLLAWWQPFTPGTFAVRLALEPRMVLPRKPTTVTDEGRDESTSGAARPAPEADIPPELLPLARRAAELRIEREGLSARIHEVVLRELWIEAQTMAMEQRLTFEEAMQRALEAEARKYGEETND